MATPTIRTVAAYSTHKEYSIDSFGDAFKVTVTPTPSVVSRWISNVRAYNHRRSFTHPLVVGVGVQWTPVTNPPPGSYYGDTSSSRYYSTPPPYNNYADPSPGSYNADPPADTLQLYVGKHCLIIQLSHCYYVPDELRSFLSDPETTYVGVWNHQDAGKLARSRHELQIGRLLDLRNYVQDGSGRSMRGCSLEVIVEVIMGYQGVRLDPEISMSDWSAYDLSHEQILQASLDVYVCSELGVWLRLWEF